jgi:hypothetical protein
LLKKSAFSLARLVDVIGGDGAGAGWGLWTLRGRQEEWALGAVISNRAKERDRDKQVLILQCF